MANVTVSGPFQYNFNTPLSGTTSVSSNTGSILYNNGLETLSIQYDNGTLAASNVAVSQSATPSGPTVASVSIDVRGMGLSLDNVVALAKTNYDSFLSYLLRGNDTVSGSSANLVGGDGNDRLYETGSGTVDGGTGLNTLLLSQGFRDSAPVIHQTGEQNFTITQSAIDITSPNPSTSSTITATGIQRIQINASVTAFDISGDAGQAYRIYQAAFARTPDTPGLSDQVNALDHGLSLHDLAANFLGSAEFAQHYGTNLSNTDFVTALYQNALHRAPDAPGLANWVNALNAGAIDRATTLASFSESLENHIATDPILVTGIHLDPTHLYA